MIFRLSFGPLLRLNETRKGANMKKTIQLDEETTRLLDEVRGDVSRSEYIDTLLKSAQGVTLSHTTDPTMETERDK